MIRDSSIRGLTRPLVIAILILAAIQADLTFNSGCSMPLPVAIASLCVFTALIAFSKNRFREADALWAGISAGVGFAGFIALKRLVATHCTGESLPHNLPVTIAIAIFIGVIAGLMGSYFCFRQRKRPS
jgi:Na+/H+-translocating membrane pyrophosphatase